MKKGAKVLGAIVVLIVLKRLFAVLATKYELNGGEKKK
jgi:hypothetical protein